MIGITDGEMETLKILLLLFKMMMEGSGVMVSFQMLGVMKSHPPILLLLVYTKYALWNIKYEINNLNKKTFS